jgi:hypothetical protein
MLFIFLLLVDPRLERYRRESGRFCAVPDISISSPTLASTRIKHAMTGHSPSIQALEYVEGVP